MTEQVLAGQYAGKALMSEDMFVNGLVLLTPEALQRLTPHEQTEACALTYRRRFSDPRFLALIKKADGSYCRDSRAYLKQLDEQVAAAAKRGREAGLEGEDLDKAAAELEPLLYERARALEAVRAGRQFADVARDMLVRRAEPPFDDHTQCPDGPDGDEACSA
jgi:hypothetical protein